MELFSIRIQRTFQLVSTNYKSLIISVFIKTVVYYVKLEWILYNIIV